MRLDDCRLLVMVNNQQRCGYCLSRQVELAEFEKVRYHGHEGEKVVCKAGYFCLDCEQISQPDREALDRLTSDPHSSYLAHCTSLAGPKTW